MAYHAVEALDSLTERDGVIDLGVGWARISRKQDPREAGEHAADGRRGVGPRPRPAAPRPGRRRPPAAPRRQLVLGQPPGRSSRPSAALVVPFLADGRPVRRRPRHLDASSTGCWSARSASPPRRSGPSAPRRSTRRARRPAPDGPAPRATAVIAAYLPNEADTIVETVETFLAQDYAGGLQIVLAYNTPIRARRRGRARRARRDAPRPDGPQGARQHLEGAERQRRAARRRGRVRRHLRRRPPPDGRRVRPRLAVDRRRRRRRPGSLRDPQRRRLRARQADRGRVRADLRRRPPGSRVGCSASASSAAPTATGARPRWSGSACAAPSSPRTSRRRCASSRPAAGSSTTPAWSAASSRPRPSKALWNQRMRWAQGWFQVSLPAPVADADVARTDLAPAGRRRLPARLARGLPVARAAGLAADRLLRLA